MGLGRGQVAPQQPAGARKLSKNNHDPRMAAMAVAAAMVKILPWKGAIFPGVPVSNGSLLHKGFCAARREGS
jgi:hypothetical protein